MPKLTKELIDKYNKAKAVVGEFEESITDRITEVIYLIAEALGNKRSQRESWWFPDANPGEIGTVNISGEYLYIEIEASQQLGDYAEFPSSFLYMGDDEIIKWIEDDIAAEEERKLKREAARLSKKKDHEELRKSAISKLTKAELKAIRVERGGINNAR